MSRTDNPLSPLMRRLGVLLVFALLAVLIDDPLVLKLLPAFAHLWLLVTFATTLRQGPPFAEQFARRAHGGDLPPFLRPYTRNVTILWCAFFAINVVIYAWLAVAPPSRTWALYTGFGYYASILALVVGEYVFHKIHFRLYEDVWTDRFWRRLFPPEDSRRGRRSLAWQASRKSEACASSAAT
ncbi:MAG: hypothetical protein ABR538_12095 [Candidatus Binatia bacterium]